MLSEKIIGVWELQSWETVVDDRVAGYPLEEKASGFIAYHPIGFMSVNISAPNRVRLPIDDPFEGDPKLLALDAKGYLSYCGPFSIVSEHEVIHHLKLCSFENWVGSDQHRYAQLNENTLTLSTPPKSVPRAEGYRPPGLAAYSGLISNFTQIFVKDCQSFLTHCARKQAVHRRTVSPPLYTR